MHIRCISDAFQLVNENKKSKRERFTDRLNDNMSRFIIDRFSSIINNLLMLIYLKYNPGNMSFNQGIERYLPDIFLLLFKCKIHTQTKQWKRKRENVMNLLFRIKIIENFFLLCIFGDASAQASWFTC